MFRFPCICNNFSCSNGFFELYLRVSAVCYLLEAPEPNFYFSLMATQFYLGNLTPNVQSGDLFAYFELKGFKPREFEVKVFRRKEGARTVGAKLTVFKRIDIHEMVELIGTSRPEIEGGHKACKPLLTNNSAFTLG